MSRQFPSEILLPSMQLAYVLSHVPWWLVQHPAALLPLQCCLKCTVQPEVLELDGVLALHVHLACKSIMMPLLPHKSLNLCCSFAGHQHCRAASIILLSTCAPELGEKHQAASSAFLLQHTLMVSSSMGCSVDCMGCPVDCIGCSWCVGHQINRAACARLQLCSRSVLGCIDVADAAI